MSNGILSEPSKRETRFFEAAKRISYKSDHDKCQIGSVIVVGNYVVSSGFSTLKTHPLQAEYDRKTCYHGQFNRLHAEISALISSGRIDLSNGEIYIYREDKTGSLANCRPCISCARAIKDAGIKHVFYTLKEGYAYECW